MKGGILSVVLFFVVTNMTGQHKSYEEAIKECHHKMEVIQKKYPNNRLFAVRPECIKGAILPPIELSDLTGKIYDLDSLRGKWSVINFWFTTCPPCIKEMPWFNNIREDLGDEKIQYIAISRDGEAKTKEFLDGHRFSFEIIPDGKDIIESTFGNKWGYPLTIIVDPELIIVHAFTGANSEEELRNNIIPYIND